MGIVTMLGSVAQRLAPVLKGTKAAEGAIGAEVSALVKGAGLAAKVAPEATVMLEQVAAPSRWQQFTNRLSGTPQKFTVTDAGVISHIDHTGSLALFSKNAEGIQTAQVIRKGYGYTHEALETAATRHVTWPNERKLIQAEINQGKSFFGRLVSAESPTSNRVTQQAILDTKINTIKAALPRTQGAISTIIAKTLEEFGYVAPAVKTAETTLAAAGTELAEASTVVKQNMGKYTGRALEEANAASKGLAL